MVKKLDKITAEINVEKIDVSALQAELNGNEEQMYRGVLLMPNRHQISS